MIARSKFNALIFDTETCFKNEHQGLIAEIGWTFGNVLNQQDTPTTRRFLVADTLLNPNYWLHSQKFEKIILEKMINNPGKVFSRIDIGNLIKIDKERSIDVIITRLRKKIETNPKNPKYLQTIRGSGYVLWVE